MKNTTAPTGKTFIEFESAWIDTNNVKSVERTEGWDDKEERIMFRIIINNPDRVKIDSFLPTYTFKYATEELREQILQELREKLEMKGVKFI